MGVRAEGFGIVERGELLIRTVSDTRRAAIVNWLLVGRRIMPLDSWPDDKIFALWDAQRGEAECRRVRVLVK